MAIQNINIGFAANDGTGDDLREAMIKINQNFQELDSIAEQTGRNLGSAGAEIFKEVVNNEFLFRRLVGGTNTTLVQHDNSVTIDVDVPTTLYVISGDTGSMIAGNVNYAINGAEMISVAVSENQKTITISGSLQDDTSPVLGAGLDGNNQNITGVNNFSANSVLTDDVTTTDIETTNLVINGNLNNLDFESRLGVYLKDVTGFDFGAITLTPSSILDIVIQQAGVDMGTMSAPAGINLDYGTIV